MSISKKSIAVTRLISYNIIIKTNKLLKVGLMQKNKLINNISIIYIILILSFNTNIIFSIKYTPSEDYLKTLQEVQVKKQQEQLQRYNEELRLQNLESLEKSYEINKNKEEPAKLPKKNAPIRKIKPKKIEPETIILPDITSPNIPSPTFILPEKIIEPEILEQTIEEQEGVCFNITKIELINIKTNSNKLIISNRNKAKILNKYINSCLYLENFDDIIADITNWYIDKGYTTTRVYIKQQNIASGNLTFYVLEGEVDNIIKNNNKWYDKLSIWLAFPFVKNKVFNLRDIEQGIDQLNSLQSNNAISQIIPAEKEGKSVVAINTPSTNYIRVFIGTRDAFTRDNIEKITFNTRLETDSLLLLNESLTFSYNYQPKPYREFKNEGFTFNASIPFGYTTISGSYGKKHNNTVSILEGSGKLYKRFQTNENSSLSINHILIKGKTAKVTLSSSGSFSNTNINIFTDNNPSLVGKGQIGSTFNTDFGIDYSNSYSKGFYYIKPSVTIGTKLFGAKKDYNFNTTEKSIEGHYQFIKYNLSTNLCHFTGIIGIKYCNNITAQYSPILLYGSDRIFLGGRYSIKGYNDTSYGGESGFYMQNEFTLPIPFFANAFNGKLQKFISLQAYTSIDLGYAKIINAKFAGNSQDDGEFLSGFGVGIKNNSKWLTFKLEAALPIYHSRVGKNFSKSDKGVSKIEKYDIDYFFEFTIKVW
jgi:hemolysin activation/secretion protein